MNGNSSRRNSHQTDSLVNKTENSISDNKDNLIEESIDDFLRTPIDSRCNNNESNQIFEEYAEITLPTKKRSNPVQITVRPSNFNSVLFDWDSTIHQLSNKLKPEKPRPKSRGLPNIAKREIQKENQELKPYIVNRVTDNRERKIVYPPRKNELPLLRKAPSLLSEMNYKRKRRYV